MSSDVMTRGTRQGWALATTSIAIFIVVLDNLVVTNALPDRPRSLSTSLGQIEWIMNGYMVMFAALLLTNAGGVRGFLSRRHVFLIGLVLFTVSSVAAALGPSGNVLLAVRALQGAGEAILLPLILASAGAAFGRERPGGAAVGIWSGGIGLVVAIGPLLGVALVQGIT